MELKKKVPKKKFRISVMPAILSSRSSPSSPPPRGHTSPSASTPTSGAQRGALGARGCRKLHGVMDEARLPAVIAAGNIVVRAPCRTCWFEDLEDYDVAQKKAARVPETDNIVPTARHPSTLAKDGFGGCTILRAATRSSASAEKSVWTPTPNSVCLDAAAFPCPTARRLTSSNVLAACAARLEDSAKRRRSPRGAPGVRRVARHRKDNAQHRDA